MLRIGGVAAIPAVLADFGLEPEAILIEAGVDPQLLNDPDNLITYAARNRLVGHCVAKTGCRHFGLLMGMRMNLREFGLLGMLMMSVPDVGQALRILVSSLQVHSQGAIMTLRTNDDLATLSYDVVSPAEEGVDQIGDGAVAIMLNAMRTLCGPEFEAVEASFAHGRPADVEPFQKFFRIPLYFEAGHFSLVFPKRWLNASVPTANEEMQRLLQNQLDAIRSDFDMEFPEQVRAILRSALLTSRHGEEQVAALFGMTVRTFIRRLDACGTSFHALVDECRFELARQMLKTTALPVQQIAEALGYARSSTFIRAFRRWSSVTPARWRKVNAGLNAQTESELPLRARDEHGDAQFRAAASSPSENDRSHEPPPGLR